MPCRRRSIRLRRGEVKAAFGRVIGAPSALTAAPSSRVRGARRVSEAGRAAPHPEPAKRRQSSTHLQFQANARADLFQAPPSSSAPMRRARRFLSRESPTIFARRHVRLAARSAASKAAARSTPASAPLESRDRPRAAPRVRVAAAPFMPIRLTPPPRGGFGHMLLRAAAIRLMHGQPRRPPAQMPVSAAVDHARSRLWLLSAAPFGAFVKEAPHDASTRSSTPAAHVNAARRRPSAAHRHAAPPRLAARECARHHGSRTMCGFCRDLR